EMLASGHALHPILAIKDHARSAVGIEHRRGGRQPLEPMSGVLTARAVAGGGQNRPTDCLHLDLAALARRDCIHSGPPLDPRRLRRQKGFRPRRGGQVRRDVALTEREALVLAFIECWYSPTSG